LFFGGVTWLNKIPTPHRAAEKQKWETKNRRIYKQATPNGVWQMPFWFIIQQFAKLKRLRRGTLPANWLSRARHRVDL
jgi:hypothetical protein